MNIDIDVASEDKSIECDFCYVWRWQFYQKIIDDNYTFNNSLFVDDDNWNRFKIEVEKISKTIKNGKMYLPAKFNLSVMANPQVGTFAPALSVEPVDLSKNNFASSSSYRKFAEIINTSDTLFQNVTRTDIPYYIFVDELEAYRGVDKVFFRDLRMIRDLLLTIKRLNDQFRGNAKIICSVRLEILNSINR